MAIALGAVAVAVLLPCLARSQAEERRGDAPPPAVRDLDLPRYAGTWHEIARYPHYFQRRCVRDVTATYTLKSDGRIEVLNACRKGDGGLESVQGEARVVAPGKLEVRFAPAWLSFLPFVWADYWVIELAQDYSHAVVGGPSRDYLWILARGPRMDEATYSGITQRLGASGYDTSKLVRSAP